MKNYLQKFIVLALLFCSTTTLLAQSPQKMSYQAVIRNTSGSLVANTSVRIRVSVLQGSETGTAVFVETQLVTTNANGLATMAIGGGTAVTGTFAGINWATGTYFIKIETDPTGGTNYGIVGTSQLLSVPYALYSGSSQNQGKTTIFITGNITNAQAAAQIAAEIGPHTENVYIQNTTTLTNIDLSTITSLITLRVKDNTNLTSINFKGLTTTFQEMLIEANPALSELSFPSYITGSDGITIQKNNVLTSITFPILNKMTSNSYFSISNNPLLTSFSMPSIVVASTISIYDSKISSISFPLLIISDISFGNNNLLTSISLPLLKDTFTSYNGITIDGNILLTSISLPSLTTTSNIHIYSNSVLKSVNLPSLISAGNLGIFSNPALTMIGIPSLTSLSDNYNNTNLDSNALPSSQINTLLHNFLSITPVSGKNIYLKQTPAAPPTGQGIIDKAALINAGNNVTTD